MGISQQIGLGTEEVIFSLARFPSPAIRIELDELIFSVFRNSVRSPGSSLAPSVPETLERAISFRAPKIMIIYSRVSVFVDAVAQVLANPDPNTLVPVIMIQIVPISPS